MSLDQSRVNVVCHSRTTFSPVLSWASELKVKEKHEFDLSVKENAFLRSVTMSALMNI